MDIVIVVVHAPAVLQKFPVFCTKEGDGATGPSAGEEYAAGVPLDGMEVAAPDEDEAAPAAACPAVESAVAPSMITIRRSADAQIGRPRNAMVSQVSDAPRLIMFILGYGHAPRPDSLR